MPDRRDQRARRRAGPDDPRAGERGAVQAHGVRERLLADHLHVEALPRGVVDRRDEPGERATARRPSTAPASTSVGSRPRRQSRATDDREARSGSRSGSGACRSGRRARRRRRPSSSIGPNRAPRSRRGRCRCCVRAAGRATTHAVKFIHVPTADTNCPDRYSRKFREVRSERNVRASAAPSRGLIGRLSREPLEDPAAALRGSRAPRGRARGRAWPGNSSVRRRARWSSLRPSGVTCSQVTRPSSGSGVRSIRPALDQRRDRPGHRGLLDVLVRGELARRHRAVRSTMESAAWTRRGDRRRRLAPHPARRSASRRPAGGPPARRVAIGRWSLACAHDSTQG